MSVRYNSLRDVVQADIGKALEEGGRQGLNEAADFMVTIWKGLSPVDTGTYEKSVRKEESGNIIRVLAGGYQFINPKTHHYCDYAVHVENRYHCGAQARETVVHAVGEMVKRRIVERLQV